METRRTERSTRSFDQWALRERELRAFLQFGLIFGEEGLRRRWDEIESRPSDGSEETIDVFDRELSGLGPYEFEWMLLAAVVKDAVTLYEVYLEQAASEVLQWHGLSWASEEAPRWHDLRGFYLYLGIDLFEEQDVRTVRRLRHLLTHRRGALETDDDRATYGSRYPFRGETVELSEDRVVSALDLLATSVGRFDSVAYEYSWGRRRVSKLHGISAALRGEAPAS